MIKYELAQAVCRGKVHCTLCRARNDNGNRFRADVVQHLLQPMPVDFECPRGIKWDCTTEPDVKQKLIPVREPVEKLPTDMLIPEVKLSKERFEICKKCDKASEGGHKCILHKACCFGRWRSKLDSKCYKNKW